MLSACPEEMVLVIKICLARGCHEKSAVHHPLTIPSEICSGDGKPILAAPTLNSSQSLSFRLLGHGTKCLAVGDIAGGKHLRHYHKVRVTVYLLEPFAQSLYIGRRRAKHYVVGYKRYLQVSLCHHSVVNFSGYLPVNLL